MQVALTYLGAGIILLWGVGHMIPTRNIVSGFGQISRDNGRIITMEWLAEGLALCFIGVLVALTTHWIGLEQAGARVVLRACAGMLLLLAILSAFTGARTTILPMKLCPWIKTAVAAMWIAATTI
jgi:hypothetical protein